MGQRSLRSSRGFFERKGYNKTGKGEGRAAFQAKVDGVVSQMVGTHARHSICPSRADILWEPVCQVSRPGLGEDAPDVIAQGFNTARGLF